METPDANLKKVFDDNDECDPDVFEDRTVEGWSFVQGISPTAGNQQQQ